MAIYGYPDMGRFGLGHSLIAWARCTIWCEQMGVAMLAPRWLRLRVGPYLRGERDKREYFKLFSNQGLITEPTRSWRLMTAHKIEASDGFFEEDIFSQAFIDKLSNSSRDTVVIFNNAIANNESKHFHNVFGHSSLLKQRLIQIVHPKYQPKVDPLSIAIHIRRGDFTPVTELAEIKSNNIQLPLSWYESILKKLRHQLGFEVPVIVYSDGTDNDLASILQMPYVQRAPKQESVTDLLSIAQAPLLIASRSGFSVWGAFLGQVPTIHHPGCRIVNTLDRQDLEVEIAEQELLPDSFIQNLASELKSRASLVDKLK